jgi:hypothetical protein
MADHLHRSARRWVEPVDEWRDKVAHWVDAGIVSSARGDEIVALESSESAPSSNESRSQPDKPTLSTVVELMAYVGVVVVGLGIILFLGPHWSGLGLAGHASVALMVTVAGLAGGFVVGQFGDAGARRLSGFLRFLGTAGAAMTTGVAVRPAAEGHRGVALFCVGAVVLALSAALWRNLDRPLQFLTTLLGVAITLGAVGIVAHLHATSTEVALLVWFFAIAVGLMSLQMLRPAPTALVAAELVSFVGALVLSFPNHLGGVLLGIFSTLCAIGIGFALDRPLIIVIGALGFFMFDFRIFAIFVRTTNAALGAFVLGLVLVFVALWRARRATTVEGRDVKTTMEVHADAEWYEPW